MFVKQGAIEEVKVTELRYRDEKKKYGGNYQREGEIVRQCEKDT